MASQTSSPIRLTMCSLGHLRWLWGRVHCSKAHLYDFCWYRNSDARFREDGVIFSLSVFIQKITKNNQLPHGFAWKSLIGTLGSDRSIKSATNALLYRAVELKGLQQRIITPDAKPKWFLSTRLPLCLLMTFIAWKAWRLWMCAFRSSCDALG